MTVWNCISYPPYVLNLVTNCYHVHFLDIVEARVGRQTSLLNVIFKNIFFFYFKASSITRAHRVIAYLLGTCKSAFSDTIFVNADRFAAMNKLVIFSIKEIDVHFIKYK